MSYNQIMIIHFDFFSRGFGVLISIASSNYIFPHQIKFLKKIFNLNLFRKNKIEFGISMFIATKTLEQISVGIELQGMYRKRNKRFNFNNAISITTTRKKRCQSKCFNGPSTHVWIYKQSKGLFANHLELVNKLNFYFVSTESMGTWTKQRAGQKITRIRALGR
jgi:hypothetical protein